MSVYSQIMAVCHVMVMIHHEILLLVQILYRFRQVLNIAVPYRVHDELLAGEGILIFR